MPATGARLIGVNEVGHITGTDPGTDNTWGNTQQEGVTLQLTTETVDLMSAQAKMKEDVNLVSATMQLVINLVTANLQTFQRLWGMPVTALGGDLSGGTPTPEILTFTQGNLASTELRLYVLGPGPRSTRRIVANRCRVADLGNITFASNAYVLPSATWEVLNPPAGVNPLVITDAV